MGNTDHTSQPDGLARIQSVIDELKATRAELCAAIERRGGKPNPPADIPTASVTPEHFAPEPQRRPALERLIDWAFAIALGMLMGITAGAQF